MSEKYPPDKEMKKLFRKIKDHGWEFRKRRNSHYVLEGPEGQKVFCSATPSDRHGVNNVKRDLARAGLDLEK